ncbi:MAG: retroviral-like aspartic protease family protein [Pseudomonadota bacterium]|nr:retroviral-like aspartic protease family protein [Pseudomonadota bacterium]
MSSRLARKHDSRKHRSVWCGLCLSVSCALGLGAPRASADAPQTEPAAVSSAAAIDEFTEIVVEAPEPRYVSPTRRDQIGRIWAPVMINGHGPFRLVLDTGASHSAVTALVALALGIPTDKSPPVILHGVTGSATVPTIHVDSLTVGDLAVDSPTLPIVPDALGGAQGILGAEGLSGKRIFIDFRHDKISITFSHNERSARDFVDIPFHSIRGTLVVVAAMVGNVPTKAIIDTGGQTTIANLALRDALSRRAAVFSGTPDQIIGATTEVQDGVVLPMPPIEFGGVHISDAGVTFANMYIFKQWKLLNEPAILIGMDALGLLDTLVIDYRRHELQMRMLKKG